MVSVVRLTSLRVLWWNLCGDSVVRFTSLRVWWGMLSPSLSSTKQSEPERFLCSSFQLVAFFIRIDLVEGSGRHKDTHTFGLVLRETSEKINSQENIIAAANGDVISI